MLAGRVPGTVRTQASATETSESGRTGRRRCAGTSLGPSTRPQPRRNRPRRYCGTLGCGGPAVTQPLLKDSLWLSLAGDPDFRSLVLPTPFGRRCLCNLTPSPTLASRPPCHRRPPPRPPPHPRRPLVAHSLQCTFRGGGCCLGGGVQSGLAGDSKWFKCLIPHRPPPPSVQLGPRAASRTSSCPPPTTPSLSPVQAREKGPLPQGAALGPGGMPPPHASPASALHPGETPPRASRRLGGRRLHFHPPQVGHGGEGYVTAGPLRREEAGPVQGPLGPWTERGVLGVSPWGSRPSAEGIPLSRSKNTKLGTSGAP